MCCYSPENLPIREITFPEAAICLQPNSDFILAKTPPERMTARKRTCVNAVFIIALFLVLISFYFLFSRLSRH